MDNKINEMATKLVRSGKRLLRYNEVFEMAKNNNIDYYEFLKELNERGFKFNK